MNHKKINIRETSLQDITDFLTGHGEKAFRAKQIWQWLWQRGVSDFNEMSNLSKETRELLENTYYFDKLIPLPDTNSIGRHRQNKLETL